MTAIAGVFNAGGIKQIHAKKMIAELEVYFQRKDYWENKEFAASRLHHGTIAPSHQPVISKDGNICLFMDGELYNSDELQNNKTSTILDQAQFCLSLYLKGKNEDYALLDGSFSLVIYDSRAPKITLITDRLGTRPLIYTLWKGNLFFSSHIHALLQNTDIPRRMNKQAVMEYFLFQRTFGDNTLYTDIFAIPGATIVTFDGGKPREEKYWNLIWKKPFFSKKEGPFIIAEAIIKALQRRTKDDLRYSLLLSGGVDSRMLMAGLEKKIGSITFAPFKNREYATAKKVADLFNSPHRFYPLQTENYFQCWDEATSLMGGMLKAPVGYFDIMKSFKETTDITLNGLGLDFTLRGSRLPRRLKRYARVPWLLRLEEETVGQSLMNNYKSNIGPHFWRNLFNPSLKSEIDDNINSSMNGVIDRFKEHNDNLYNLWDFVTLETSYKQDGYGSSLAIRFFLEDRNPAFDNELIDIYLSMPLYWRFNQSIYRKALQHLSAEAAKVIDATSTFKAGLPLTVEALCIIGNKLFHKFGLLEEESLANPVHTQRTWPNYDQIFMRDKGFRDVLMSVSKDRSIQEMGLFNMDVINAIISQFVNGESKYMRFIFLLLTFCSWNKQFGFSK